MKIAVVLPLGRFFMADPPMRLMQAIPISDCYLDIVTGFQGSFKGKINLLANAPSRGQAKGSSLDRASDTLID